MNKIIWITLSFFCATTLFSQTIKIVAIQQPQSNFERALQDFEKIRFYDFKFVNKTEASKVNYKIIVTEFVNGKPISQEVFIESKPEISFYNFVNNELPFSIFSKYESETKHKMMFGISTILKHTRSFDLDKKDDFDLKMLVSPRSEFELGKTYPFCALVKPVKIAENTYRNCDFNAEIDRYKEWFNIFGIDRYIVFEIRFDP